MQDRLDDVLDRAEQLEAAGDVDGALQLLREENEARATPQIDLLIGSILAAAGRREAAEEHYEAAASRWPGIAEFPFNRGNLHFACGENEQALACYKRAAELAPTHAKAKLNLGLAAVELEDWNAAVDALPHALKIFPGHQLAWKGLIKAHDKLRQRREACLLLSEYMRRWPDDVGAVIDMGDILRESGLLDIAIRTVSAAIGRATPLQRVHLMGNRLAMLYGLHGQASQAVACMREALKTAPDDISIHLGLLMQMQYATDVSQQDMIDEIMRFGRRHSVYRHLVPSVTPDPHRKLRVGLVSGSFHQHPVSFLTLPALEHLPPEEFELVVFRTAGKTDDWLTERFRRIASAWHETGRISDRELAQLIQSERIDILFDLAGSGEGGHILVFARKPAPVQIKWVGNQYHSSGLPAMDYFLSDSVETPPGYDEDYAEKLLRMPDGYVCYLPPDYAPAVTPLPALKNGFVTFGCYNNIVKLSPLTVEMWARILREVPGSRLLLKNPNFADPLVAEQIRDRFMPYGIDRQRIECRAGSPHQEFLRQYGDMDIALDPHPYTGGLTTCEALWMGIPVITLPGRTFASRHAASHLSNVGLTDWIADSPDSYVSLAKSWAGRLQELAVLRSGLRDKVAASPLIDAPRFAANLARELRRVWTTWCTEREDVPNVHRNQWLPADLATKIISIKDAREPSPESAPSSLKDLAQEAVSCLSGDPVLAKLPEYRFTSLSLHPAGLAFLKEEIRRLRPKTILEFGSGISTCVLSACQREVVDEVPLYISLDQSSQFSQSTRDMLQASGAGESVQIWTVPLDYMVVHHLSSTGYGLHEDLVNRILEDREIDMVIVDGPFSGPGWKGASMRLCTVPAIRQKLAPGAAIYMTDALRKPELDVATEWGDLNYLDIAGIARIGTGILIARAQGG